MAKTWKIIDAVVLNDDTKLAKILATLTDDSSGEVNTYSIKARMGTPAERQAALDALFARSRVVVHVPAFVSAAADYLNTKENE